MLSVVLKVACCPFVKDFKANTNTDFPEKTLHLYSVCIARFMPQSDYNINTEHLVWRNKNGVKYGVLYTRLRRGKVCDHSQSKFPLSHLLQCPERPGPVSKKPTLFLSWLYYETS